jgi:hypothetical protein
VRVGALDGRHSKTAEQVLQRIALATTAGARLFIDSGNPQRELPIPRTLTVTTAVARPQLEPMPLPKPRTPGAYWVPELP